MSTAADWMAHGSFRHHDFPLSAQAVRLWRSLASDRWALAQISRRLSDPAIRLELWDGTAVGPAPSAARVRVVLGNRLVLYWLIWDAEVCFGDAFSAGHIRVTGDLAHLLEVAYRAPGGVLLPWRPRLPANDPSRAHDNVQRHYDLGNEFYRLWLDEQLVYTCAYFPTPDATLEQAQDAKMELVCRKLRLVPGERVVEAGCGWGALAIYMAKHFGVRVTAYNVSREQIEYARRRAVAEGLDTQVEFIEDDYRSVTGRFDKFVSVGMLEHVGQGQYRDFGAVIDRTLDSRHGRGLLHFIGRNAPEPLSRWITKRIFPGAYPPALAEATGGVLEPWRFSVLDVENLRLHYARTLEHWLARYDAVGAKVADEYGERFARAWRLYLVGSMVGFRTGSLQLFQVVFAREHDNDVPWTRAGLYDDPRKTS